MADKFTRLSFDEVINIEKIITIFYMELSKDFAYEGEKHDFWEMVYLDKGEAVCIADNNRYILKSGEITFHKPNQFHNLSGNLGVGSNIGIITFECRDECMEHFENRIFQLNSEEKTVLSTVFDEGLSCYKLTNESSPLSPTLQKIENSPFGSGQMTKNLIEIFLIKLLRRTTGLDCQQRFSYIIDGIDIPIVVKKALAFMQDNIRGRITVSDIARHLNMSESSLKQLFSQYYKNGMINHYNRLKINEAKKLLKENKYTVSQISEMLCYDNPQYFSKCFKKNIGMTPTQYAHSIKTRA